MKIKRMKCLLYTIIHVFNFLWFACPTRNLTMNISQITVYMYTHVCVYIGTPLTQTLLGSFQSVLIRGVSLFQGLFYIHKIRSGPHAVSVLQWMSAFQGCPQTGFHCKCIKVFCLMLNLHIFHG